MSKTSQPLPKESLLTESIPETAFGTVPPSEYQSAFEAYQAYEEGVFDDVPLALDAYLDHQRSISEW